MSASNRPAYTVSVSYFFHIFTNGPINLSSSDHASVKDQRLAEVSRSNDVLCDDVEIEENPTRIFV